jgi:hypothetical protein
MITVEKCGDGSKIVSLGPLKIRIPSDASDSWLFDAKSMLLDAKKELEKKAHP